METAIEKGKREICPICKKGILTSNKNCVFVNGVAFHGKCVKKEKQGSKNIELRKGKDAILNAILYLVQKENPEIEKLTDEQIRLICIQISNLVNQGYDLKTQLEAFKHYFEKGKEYKGYGIMLYVIAQEVAEMEKENKVNKVINESSTGLSIKDLIDKQRKK